MRLSSFLGLMLAFVVGLASATDAKLSPAERVFLKAHPRIVLGTEKSWEPYVIVDANGQINGYDAEILARINALTGAHFQLKAGVWREMQEQARARQIDGLSTGGIHAERRQYLNFSDIYISLNKMLLVAQGNPRSIHGQHDLAGRRIAVHRGNLVDEKLAAKYPEAKIIPLETTAEMVQAVVKGDVDAIFDNGTTLYLAQKLGLPYLEIAFDLGEKLELAFGVRKDWPQAIDILNKGLAAIPLHERLMLQQRWFLGGNRQASDRELLLTAEEQSYLERKQRIHLCVDPDWMPYERIDPKGNHEGIIADLHRDLAKRLGLAIELVPTRSWAESLDATRTHRCDMLSGAVATPERETYLGFTRSFLDVPLVIVTLAGKTFVDTLNDVRQQTFAMLRGHAVVEMLRRRYPELSILEVENAQAGFDALRDGRAFGFIDTASTVGYAIRTGNLLDLQIAGKLAERYALAIAVHPDDPQLRAIYDKALTALSKNDIERIQDHWSSVQIIHDVDHSLVWQILAAVAVLSGLVVYRYRIVSGYNRRLQEANRLLEVLSRHDQLTGVANRRAFDTAIAREMARAQRYGTHLSLVIVDIDHFKKVNDTYGHAEGDRVLVGFARLIEGSVRATDMVVRWGGEEFIVLCPETHRDQACHLAEQLRRRVAELDFGLCGKITISLGVATWRTGEDAGNLIKRVDEALYRAKDSGRNRVELELS